MAGFEIPFGLRRTTAGQDSEWAGPYADVAAANAAVPAAVRLLRTVIIGTVEYIWRNGVADGDLVIKNVSGGTPGGSDHQLQWNNEGAFAGVPAGNPGDILKSNGSGAPPSFEPDPLDMFVDDDHLHYDSSGTLTGGLGNPNEVRSLTWFTGSANGGYVGENVPFSEPSIFNTFLQLGADAVGAVAFVRFLKFINIASIGAKNYGLIEFKRLYYDGQNNGVDQITILACGLSYDEEMNIIGNQSLGTCVYVSADGDLRFYSRNSNDVTDTLLIEDFPAGIHDIAFEHTLVTGTLVVKVDGASIFSLAFSAPGYIGGGVPFVSAVNQAGDGHQQMIDRVRIKTII